MHTTPPTDTLPEIQWERSDVLLNRDPEEREMVWVMEGTSDDERIWSAIGVYVCGEVELLNDIEEATPKLIQK